MTHEELRASMPGAEACLENLKTTDPEEISRWFSISQEYYEYRASISANEAERTAWEACLEYINNPANREWWTI